MDDTAMQLTREHIKKNEGVRPQPYKDTKGKLTIGSGLQVDDEASFLAKQLQIDDPVTGKRRLATEAEKKAGFNQAKSLSQKELEDGASKFFLSEEENIRLIDAEILDRIEKIKVDIGPEAWGRLTDGQRTALIDIHYANGSLRKFPKLKEAAKRGDAKAMAEQADFHNGEITKTDPKTGKPKETGFQYRDFDRLRRNYAAMSGIDPESFDAYYAIANKYRNHPRLKDNYKVYLSQKRPESQSPAGKGGTGSTLLTGGGADEAFKAFLLSEEERQDLRMRKLYPTMYSEQE